MKYLKNILGANPNLNEMDKDRYKSEINSLIKDRMMLTKWRTYTFVNKSLNIWSRKFQNSYLSLENIQKNIVMTLIFMAVMFISDLMVVK